MEGPGLLIPKECTQFWSASASHNLVQSTSRLIIGKEVTVVLLQGRCCFLLKSRAQHPGFERTTQENVLSGVSNVHFSLQNNAYWGMA